MPFTNGNWCCINKIVKKHEKYWDLWISAYTETVNGNHVIDFNYKVRALYQAKEKMRKRCVQVGDLIQIAECSVQTYQNERGYIYHNYSFGDVWKITRRTVKHKEKVIKAGRGEPVTVHYQPNQMSNEVAIAIEVEEDKKKFKKQKENSIFANENKSKYEFKDEFVSIDDALENEESFKIDFKEI